jgi:hypothetical protein
VKKQFLFILVLTILSSVSLSAKEEKNVKYWMHAKLYLKNDSVVEGYLHNYFVVGGYMVSRTFHEPCSNDSVMRINSFEKLFGKDRKYSNNDIDSMITWKDAAPQYITKWEPQRAIFSYGNQEPITSDHPVMLKIAYQGKNVTGYIINHRMFGYKCLYKTKDMSYAKAYFNIEKKLSERRRKTMLEEFGNYPEMEKYIMELDKKSMKTDPFAILEVLDSVIERQQSKG